MSGHFSFSSRRIKRQFEVVNAIVLIMVLLLFPIGQVQGHSGSGSDHLETIAGVSSFMLAQNKNANDCSDAGHCALQFNGVNQWVEEDQFRGFDTPFFTLEAWVNWSGEGKPFPGNIDPFSGKIPLITLSNDQASAPKGIHLFLGIDADTGHLFVAFFSQLSTGASGSSFYTLTGATAIVADEWHHVAATFDGQLLRIYIDGSLDAETEFSEQVLPDVQEMNEVTLAAALPKVDKGMGFFKGMLDEVRIWETPRTQQEVLATANIEGLSDPNLIGYWMLNEGKGSKVKNEQGNGKHGDVQNNPTWVDGASMTLAAAPLLVNPPATEAVPNYPSVVSPLDGSTNISTSPSLDVDVSDPDGNDLTVTYYGRVASTSRSDFTIIVLPDTQKYTTPPPGNGIFQQQTQWIVSQLGSRNIVFVGHLGDSVDDWNVDTQWAVPDAAMRTLESAGIPYAIAPGNCDLDSYGSSVKATFFNKWFPVSRFAGRSYYGGAYNNDNSNSYQLISASGLNFIIIEIKYNFLYNASQGQAILAWANNLLQLYSDRRAIVITHNLLETSNAFSSDGLAVYNALKGNPNLFLMMGGHLDTEGMRTDPGTDGHTIYSLRSDYQTRPNGGNGWLRIMRFSPDNNKIYITTYSPYLDQFETDANSQFSLDYDMEGGGFDTLGSVSVPSGSTASLTWQGLNQETAYEWYVTANDGKSTTTSPTWKFTTGGGESAPEITLQPVNQTVNAGQTATFSAAANGSPAPSVQWQVSADNGSTWNNIAGAISTTYSLAAQSADNGKQLRAVFTNHLGSATTEAAILTVYTPPLITSLPVSQTVTEGNTATFSASASGYPLPSVQWQVSSDNGSTWVNIPNAISSTYAFTATAGDNGRQYRAAFSNPAGSATTSAAILTVYFAPVVSSQPVNQTVAVGQMVSFSSSASGNPSPSIQWQVSIDGGASWDNISGANSTSYSFMVAAGDTGKQYRTIFTNIAGSVASNAALLTVTLNDVPPVVTLNPTDLTILAGQEASFTAAASGTPAPTVQWQVSPDGSTWANLPGANSTTYSITVQSTDNGKQYRAVFTNSAGSAVTSAALLTVYTLPVITLHPSNLTINEGQTAGFTASATGNPAPSIQWQTSADGSNWSAIPGATFNTLSFTGNAADNGKRYRAEFSNAAGKVTSNPAMLTVNFVPVVTNQPVSQTVNAGQTTTFSAAATGNPVPTIQWQVSTNNGSTWTNISGATSGTYMFIAATSDNGKQYRAIFTNLVGLATTNAVVLTVHYAPTIITQPASQTVTVNQTATFNAAASGNPGPTVQWQVSANNGVSWTDITGASSATYSFTTAVADNGKQYRAVFTNSVGSVTSSAANLTVQYPPQVTTQPVNLSLTAGQTATFSAAASGNPAPTVQWQASLNGLTWTDIAGATTTPYSFTAQMTDNGKSYRAVFTNSIGSIASNSALLTVMGDVIFKDDFNACNANAWNGGAVNPARLAFNTASGRNSTCGMAVTLAKSTAAYVIDTSPANETRFHARFYFKPNTMYLPNNSSVTLFAGYSSGSRMVVNVQVRKSSSGIQVRAGILMDNNSWNYTGWSTITNAWHALEIDWKAASSATVSDGFLTFWIDGVQKGAFTGKNNDLYSIDSISLGAITGLTSKMTGTFFVDDYESRRVTYIGQ